MFSGTNDFQLGGQPTGLSTVRTIVAANSFRTIIPNGSETGAEEPFMLQLMIDGKLQKLRGVIRFAENPTYDADYCTRR